ncbi:MAG: hypothetical protein H6707_10780, partial [Deltaproteobacteria bacterium]|nr:hypothetical protein [Deltaproteobacteria bacterium]
MRYRLAFVSFFTAVLIAFYACESDNPRYCTADAQCPQKVAEGHYQDKDDGDGFVLAADKKLCHPTKNYCYAGCKTDADCRDGARRMNLWDEHLPFGEANYDMASSVCDTATGHCKRFTKASADGGTPDGGVGDAGTDAQPLKTLGQSCGGDSECDS